MQQSKELLVARIVSGTIRCPLLDKNNNKKLFVVKAPSPELRYEAEEVYAEALEEAAEDMMDLDEMVSHLMKQHQWTNDQEEAYEKIPKQIEDLKVRLSELTFKSNERKSVRHQIKTLKTEYEKLHSKRFALYQYTADGYAALVKSNFILTNTLYYDNKLVPYIPDDLLNEIYAFINRNRIDEATYREIARTDPWRNIWNLGKEQSFGVSPSCFSDEQRNLCLWSKMYDNVYEHPDTPHESVINDDDMLDGWFISRRRQREADMAKKQGDELISARMDKSDEIYLVVDSIEDARKIEALNSTMGKVTKAQRNNKIHAMGEVKEQDLPDRIQQQIIGGNAHGPV